jgi:hypothetical protein
MFLKYLKKRKLMYLLFLILVICAIFYFIFWERKILSKPNVIFITIDTLRPDHLSCYGYKRNTSPHIDNFAKDGVTFTHAISQAPVTVVSLTSFVTSVYPPKHGIISEDSNLTFLKIDVSYSTIMEILKKKWLCNSYLSSLSISSQMDQKGCRFCL